MRWSLTFAAAIAVIIPCFSTPIPRMMLRKRGLFEDTLDATSMDIEEIAAMVTNSLTSDPRPCNHVQSFFRQLAEGEKEGGVTTIGDRAVAGARRMLNLQGAGTAGLVRMVDELREGTLSNQSTTALIQAISSSSRTIASLKTYKFLLDAQAGLTALTDGIANLNGTGLKPLRDLASQIQPVLSDIEDTIDQFGADFSVQNVVNQARDIQKILSLVEDGKGNVQKLKGLNKENQQTVNDLIDDAQDPMNKLASAAREASFAANSPPNIPLEQFNGQRGTRCLPGGKLAPEEEAPAADTEDGGGAAGGREAAGGAGQDAADAADAGGRAGPGADGGEGVDAADAADAANGAAAGGAADAARGDAGADAAGEAADAPAAANAGEADGAADPAADANADAAAADDTASRPANRDKARRGFKKRRMQ